MSGAEHPTRRRQMRWFVALHVGAVGGIYALAFSIGGGLAMPPFPVNERVPLRAVGAPVTTVAQPSSPTAPTHGTSERALLPPTADLAAPWTYGSDGRAQVQAR